MSGSLPSGMDNVPVRQERSSGEVEDTVAPVAGDCMDLEELQARAQAVLQSTVRLVRKQCDSIRAAIDKRLGTMQDGKRLLDSGGKQALLAKRASLDATAADGGLVQGAQLARTSLERAAELLRAAQAAPPVEGLAGREDFGRLAEMFEARAKVYQHVADLLKEPTVAPALNPAEADALRWVEARQECERACALTVEGCSSIAESTVRNSRRACDAACA